MKRLCLFLLGITIILNGCAYGIFDDKRLLDTQAADKSLATRIKTQLLSKNFGAGFSVAVYCFFGHVFLVGEAPEKDRGQILEIARSYNPVSLTPHWFSGEEDARNNLALAADLRATLIGTKGLSSTRVDTEVNGGRVVLLGVVHDEKEKQLAISAARKVKGVTSVTSYLMIPPKR